MCIRHRHYDYRNEEFPTFPSSMEFRSSRKDQQGFIVEANLNKAVELSLIHI